MSSQFTLIEVSMDMENKYSYFIIKKQDKELYVEPMVSAVDFEYLLSKLNKNNPILLHFSGKGIISKSVSLETNIQKELLFNANPTDFYIYEFHQLHQNFVSVARCNLIDEVLAKFTSNGLIVIDYSIGPFVGALFYKVSNLSTYFSNQYELNFDDNRELSFLHHNKNALKEYKLDTEVITNYQIPLFSTLLNHLFPDERIIYDTTEFNLNKKELKHRKLFNVLSLTVLLFFLISLLISYATIDFYKNKYLEYEEQLYYLNTTYSQVTNLEQEKDKKEAIVKESGVLSDRFITSYLYDLNSSVPIDISFSELEYNPIKGKIKENEAIVIAKKTIIIVGITKSSQILNQWIKEMKNFDWIQKIEIINLSKDRNNELGFHIEILYK